MSTSNVSIPSTPDAAAAAPVAAPASRKRTLASADASASAGTSKSKAGKAPKTDTKADAPAAAKAAKGTKTATKGSATSTKAATTGGAATKTKTASKASAAAAAPAAVPKKAKAAPAKTPKAPKAAPSSAGTGAGAGTGTSDADGAGGAVALPPAEDDDIAIAARGIVRAGGAAAAEDAEASDAEAAVGADGKKKKREPVLFEYMDPDLFKKRKEQDMSREAFALWRTTTGNNALHRTFADWRASKMESARVLVPILNKARAESARAAKRAKVLLSETVEKYLARMAAKDPASFGALNGTWLSTYGLEKVKTAATPPKLVFTAAELDTGALDAFPDVAVRCALALFNFAKAKGAAPLGIVSENGKTHEDGTVTYNADVAGPRMFVGRHLKLQQKAETVFSLRTTDYVTDKDKKKKAAEEAKAAAAAAAAAAVPTADATAPDESDNDDEESVLEEGQLDGTGAGAGAAAAPVAAPPAASVAMTDD